MNSNALALDPDETVHWSGHPRLMLVLPDVAIGLLLVVVGVTSVVAPGVGARFLPEEIVLWFGVLIPIGIAIPAGTYLVVTNTLFVITDRALYVKRGVLGRRVDRLGLNRVQNTSYSQGIRGTLLGYGTVTIDTAGVDTTIRFYNIRNPRKTRTLIDEHASEDDSFGSQAQWEAVLTELQALRSALETSRIQN